MADVGRAYITLMPSMRGFAGKINTEFNSIAGSGGKAFSGLTGVVAGFTSAVAGKAIDAIAGLSSEMISAADSSQKFASTLRFAGVSDSAIKQLTASTQKYADTTVYELEDVRNVTAQLAANGVKNYAQVAEAMGNLNSVAGGNVETFKSVSLAMTQTAGAGKLTTENWNQIAEAIPGASGALQDAMRDAGAFEGNFRDAMANSQISADEFFTAVQKLGMSDVAVEAAKSTSTIEGAVGNLKASIVGVGSQAIAAITPAITKAMGILSGAISTIPSAVSVGLVALEPFGGMLSMLGQQLTLSGAAIAPLVQQITTGLAPAITQISALTPAIAAGIGVVLSSLISIGTTIATTIIPILGQVVGFVTGSLLPVVLPAVQSILQTIQIAMPLIQSIITTALTAIQAVWNTVFPVIAAVVTTVFNAITAVIQTAMGVIQGIITAVMGLISGDWSAVWNGIQQVASSVWNGISSLVSGAMNAISSVISSVSSAIAGTFSSIWSGISSSFTNIWDGLKSAATNGVNAVFNTISSIKNKITSFFAGAGSWLVNSGKALLDGFASGISSAFGKVTDIVKGGLDFVRGLFPFSPAKWGPFSGHGYTTYSGKALMQGFGQGITSGSREVNESITRAMSRAQGILSGKLSVAPKPISAPTGSASRVYNITIDGRTVSADSRIQQAIDVLVAASARTSAARGY